MRPLAHVALAPEAPALEPLPAADIVLLAPLPALPLLVVPALPPVAAGWSLGEPEAPGELEPDSVLPMWASQPWLSPTLTSTAHFHKRLAEARQVEKIHLVFSDRAPPSACTRARRRSPFGANRTGSRCRSCSRSPNAQPGCASGVRNGPCLGLETAAEIQGGELPRAAPLPRVDADAQRAPQVEVLHDVDAGGRGVKRCSTATRPR